MPTGTKTPPGSARKTAQPWLRAFGLAGPDSAYESVIRSPIPQAELDAVRRFVARVAEAQIAAEKVAGQGVLGTALQGFFPGSRLAEQMSEIAKAHVERLGKGWAGQLNKSYATNIAKTWEGAGLAPGIAERLKASVAAAEWAQPRVSIHADLERINAVNEKLARQMGGLASTGLARPWEGISASLGIAGEARALKAVEAIAAEAKRVEVMVAQATQPTLQRLERIGALEAAAARQYLRTPLAAKGFFPADRLASLYGESSILATTKLAEASVAPLAKHLASLGTIAVPDGLAEILEREPPLVTTVERFAKRWESTALWFLLSILNVGHLVALAHMEREEIEAVLLDALEAVITKGIFTVALDAAVRKAAYISADQRDDLLHGLEHAQHGEFVNAVPSLMTGLEGALWSTARALTIVDAERRQLSGKPQARSVVRIEPVVRKLPAKQDYRTFVCSRVFGDTGNPVRHGEQSDRRRQALFAIVAVAGWLDAFMKVSAHEALGLMLSEELASRGA